MVVLGDPFRGLLRTKVPVLFIRGTLDGCTLPANAEALRPDFSESRTLMVQGASDPNEP